MKIRTTGLQLGHNEIDEFVEPLTVGLDTKTFQSPISVHVNAEKGTGKIALEIVTIGPGSFFCDRCGEDFKREAHGSCEIVFVQRDAPFPDEEPGDDLRSFGPFQEYIDVSTEVRDTLHLSIPMKNLCTEDCQGLCPNCGGNLNKSACRCSK